MAQDNVQNGSDAGEVPPSVTFSAFRPMLVVEAPKAADVVQFYKAAFGAEEIGRTTHPKRKADQELPNVLSAELKLASAVFSVSDHVEGSTTATPSTGGVFVLETDDVEAAIAKAVSAGAVSEQEDGAAGEGRVGKVKDPYGFVWLISAAKKKSTSSDEVVVLDA